MAMTSAAANNRMVGSTRLMFSFTNQAPVFFHQVNISCGKPGRNVDFPIGNALVDLELGNESTVDENKEETAATLDAQSIEHDPAVLVELNERAISSVRGGIRRKRHDISFRNPRHLFDGNLFTGNLGVH